MKGLRLLQGAAVSLACWGILVPQTNLLAAGPENATKVPAIVDVALQTNGTLSGEVLDEQGVPLEGALVSVRQGKEEVAQTVADKDGRFTVTNLRGGVYQVAAGQGVGLYRLWANRTAPPSARSVIRIISQQTAVRGQFGGVDLITLLTLGASIGAVATSSVALSKINDVEDKVDTVIANDSLADLPASP